MRISKSHLTGGRKRKASLDVLGSDLLRESNQWAKENKGILSEHYRRRTAACFSEIAEATRGVIRNIENTTARKFERASGLFRFLNIDLFSAFGSTPTPGTITSVLPVPVGITIVAVASERTPLLRREEPARSLVGDRLVDPVPLPLGYGNGAA